MLRTIAAHLASLIQARINCLETGNSEWLARHTDAIRLMERNDLPSGSGIDAGTKVDLDASTPSRVVLLVSYHHMNDSGMYDGWSDYRVTIRPAFDGVMVAVAGRDRNQIKDYLADVYREALLRTIER